MPRKTKELEKTQTTLKIKKEEKPTNTITNQIEKKTTAKSNLKTSNNKTAKRTNTSKKTKTTKSVPTSKAKNSSAKKTSKKAVSTKPSVVEYYDLPYRYNQTVVKLLAQTPNTLFIYWDISDDDRQNYKKIYGDNFFETTRPVLIVRNDTMNYSFEVEINDFANSWYLHVNDSKCDYHIELGRRVINSTKTSNNNDDYIYISSSNEIESPNDRILFDKTQKMVYFRNIKNNKQISKDISTFTFIRNMGKIYNIYDLYKKIYKNENIDEISNPSSNYKGDK